MVKKLENKDKIDKSQTNNTAIVEFMNLLRIANTSQQEAEENKVSMKDGLGRRILF